MSNFLSVATVTATLSRILQSELNKDMNNVFVTISRPEAPASQVKSGVNVFLYQVKPNPAWRNADLPTRDSAGNLSQTPVIPLNLYYLLTFTGDEEDLEPQRILGSVVRTLHEQPLLTRNMILDTLKDPKYHNLLITNQGASNLADEIETVKFTPESLSLEDLSKIWSVFLQVPYNLSVAYRASVVFLEGTGRSTTALPVKEASYPFVQASLLSTKITTPDEISGLRLWLQSDKDVAYDSDGVSQWDDQSGNANNGEQSTISRRPSFVAHGIAHKPVLRFDGTDDYLAIKNLNYNTAGGASEITVCALIRSQSQSPQVVASFDDDEHWQLTIKDAANQHAGWSTTRSNGQTDNLRTTQAYNDGNWHLLYGWFQAGVSPDKKIYIDGSLVADTDAHGGDSLGTNVTRFGFIGVGSEAGAFDGSTGPSNFLEGDLAELLIFDKALTDEERQQLEQYISDRYR